MSAAQNPAQDQAQSRARSQKSTSGRGRVIMLIAVVAVLAIVAAVATVVISQRTYAPTERTLSPAIQVAAGTDYVDSVAGLTIRVPEGWQAESGALPFGTTAMAPESMTEEGGAGGIAFIGALTPEMIGDQQVDNKQAAYALASGIGPTLLPVPGQPVDEQVEEISTRAGDGWALSFRVVPTTQQAMLGSDGALVYTAVVGEGEQRYWLTYVGVPGDGSMDSPDTRWADKVVERFRPVD